MQDTQNCHGRFGRVVENPVTALAEYADRLCGQAVRAARLGMTAKQSERFIQTAQIVCCDSCAEPFAAPAKDRDQIGVGQTGEDEVKRRGQRGRVRPR